MSDQILVADWKTTEAIGIFNSVAGLMPQNSHAPVRGPALDLEHLFHFKLRES
jgi:hypothetical protein